MEKENSRKILALTLAIYRLTDKFPDQEILKIKIREAALSVLEKLTLGDKNGIIERVKVLQKYFLVANRQQWVSVINYEILGDAYQDLANQFFAPTPAKAVMVGRAVVDKPRKRKKETQNLNERQERVLELIKRNRGQANLGQIAEALKDVRRRTLINDINRIVERGLIKKSGQGRGSFYRSRAEI